MTTEIQKQMDCVAREISLRVRVYPHFVAKGKLTQQKADYELAAMREVLETLTKIRAAEDGL